MVLENFVETFLEQVAEILPNVFAGILFLITAYIVIKIIQVIVKYSLRQTYDQKMIVSLASTVVSIFMWFAAALIFLNIVGLGEIAASLGTATGFVALGVAYALSNMLADTVAGYYLVRDQDFKVGDRVRVEETEGTVTQVGMRKSRLRLENGDLAVFSNKDVEQKWVKETESASNI